MPIGVLRHLGAPLAYRAATVLRDAPPGFADVSTFAASTRQPVHSVAHMADLMAWGVTLARGDHRSRFSLGGHCVVGTQAFARN